VRLPAEGKPVIGRRGLFSNFQAKLCYFVFSVSVVG
jgi:hypothetical protein